MIVVIIAGGSGTRLWPLSTPDYPKHLLKINNDSSSLLQNTYKRARHLTKSIYVVTEAGHVNYVREQLPELDDDSFIIEPARRGTASCIIAALVHLKDRHDSKQAITFLAADHYIRDLNGFVYSFKVAGEISEREKRIVLVGVEPDYPATGFGYIKKGKLFDNVSFVFNVESFKEKPDFASAKQYLRSGNYLWNCGYFVGSLTTFVENMHTKAPKLYDEYKQLLVIKTKQDYKKTYLSFEANAIDYALIEKINNLLVVPAAFDWMDLGSFGDLYKVVESDEAGNHINGSNIEIEEVEGSFIQNQENKPVVVIGLDNCVVVNTPEGILITRKDLSQKVGELSKRFKKK